MNVYDFDGTIYKKDCSIEFYKFCLRRNIKILLALPYQIVGAALYLAGIYNKRQLKICYFKFLKYIDDIDLYIIKFWEEEVKKDCFNSWYIDKHKDTDVIISASPLFLIYEASKYLNVKNVIASKVNKYNGLFEGENCRGEEKVKLFKETFLQNDINEFYSDSLTDEPLAKIACQAYFVSDGQIQKWCYGQKKYDLIEKIRYIFWGGITTGINVVLFILFNLTGITYTVSNVVSYFIAVLISYFLNRKFVFKGAIVNSNIRSMCNYFIVRIASITLETLALFFTVEKIRLNVYFSKICISIIVILSTYILNKVFVFKNKKNK